MSKTQDYIDRYAEFAMEQMERYRIPASITLAQGLLESGKGESRLARQENNHFGIKATKTWLENGGEYGIYTDDRPNEKFCSYHSVRDSFEHHSRFIVGNARYGDCLSLPVNDYRGWAEGLQKAGYATSKSYATSLISIIESNNLQKYDQMVISSPGRYASDYQANLPDIAKDGNFRGLNRSNVVDSNSLVQNTGNDTEQNKAINKAQEENQTPKNQIDKEEDFESWMRKLYAGDDEDKTQSSGMDPITDMVISMFTSLFAIAAMIDNKTPLEQSAEARRAVNNQEIDLMPLLKEQSSKENELGMISGIENPNTRAHISEAQNPNSIKLSQEQLNKDGNQTLPGGLKVDDIRGCKFKVTEQAKATIVIEDNFGKTHSYEVSSKELSNLQSSLRNPGMDTQQKTRAVVAFIGTSMARSIDKAMAQQTNNANALDKENNNTKSNAVILTNTNSETSYPWVSPTQISNPSPTITISTAAQMSSRNFEIAENQSLSRDVQSYQR